MYVGRHNIAAAPLAPDANRRWPDVLARRLVQAGRAPIAVLNEGISGARVLFSTALFCSTQLGAQVLQAGNNVGFAKDVVIKCSCQLAGSCPVEVLIRNLG